ncbi:MAG: hypothetical protein R2708_25220 [Vicinamibacterales bacterium]
MKFPPFPIVFLGGVAGLGLALAAAGCGSDLQPAAAAQELSREHDTSRDAPLVPPPARTTWAPGIRMAAPARPEICATIAASRFGNGTQEASAAIQEAVNHCPPGRTVQLSAGTFLMNDFVQINRGITLRGAGPSQTRLVKTNGARAGTYLVDDAEPILIVGPARWPKPDPETSVDLVADAAPGAMSITVKDGRRFAPGQFVLLDQDDFHAGAWLPLPRRLGTDERARIWASDLVVFNRHDPAEWSDGKFPDSTEWFSRGDRPVNEIKEVAAVDGATVTFTTPVHIGYTIAKRAQLTRYYADNVHVREAGIEDLGVAAGGNANRRVEAAAYPWKTHVDDTYWSGEGVAISHSFRVEIRDSSIHHSAFSEPGGAGYAISLASGSSEVLIENNAVHDANKVMVVRSCGAGSVIGYNYMDNGVITSLPDWVETGLNGSHMAGSHHILFEGNQAFNYDSDNTHGNAIAMTVFRNHLVGRRSGYQGAVNQRAAGLMFGSWWHVFIGNVLGEDGRMDGWSYEDPGDGSTRSRSDAWQGGSVIWKLGYDPGHWDQVADPKVRATVLRDGNFDYVTGEVHWDRPSRELPASLYLTSKPAFFGDEPWPWVDPTGQRKLGVLPARRLAGSPPRP